jgi:hypothetical protein
VDTTEARCVQRTIRRQSGVECGSGDFARKRRLHESQKKCLATFPHISPGNTFFVFQSARMALNYNHL